MSAATLVIVPFCITFVISACAQAALDPHFSISACRLPMALPGAVTDLGAPSRLVKPGSPSNIEQLAFKTCEVDPLLLDVA